uniref:Speckle-type POZ protein-like (inferred by orthology to a human protein) n=1 Tax=Strongyloides papillosus TaxID=174720 RepID=A0A0N5CEC7_STREA
MGSRDIPMWYLNIYPKGQTEEFKEYVSVSLKLLAPDRTKLKLKFSILNGMGEEKTIVTVENFIELEKDNDWGIPDFVKRDFLLDKSNGLLVNDKLKILFEAEMIDSNDSDASTNVIIPKSKLLLDYSNFFNSQLFSDCSIIVGETKIKVHRGILAARSPVFYNIFNSKPESSQTNIIEIKNFRVEVVREMLRYIYTDDVSDLENVANELVAIAVEYGLDRLKAFAVKYLCGDLTIENVCGRFILSEKFSCEELKEYCQKFIIGNSEDLKKTNSWRELVKNHPFLVESLFWKSLNK